MRGEAKQVRPRSPDRGRPRSGRDEALAGAIAAAVGVAGHLAALSGWWCLDDWGQLARAAGLAPAPAAWPARWLSQQAWWSLTWPVLGLDAAAGAAVRLALFAATVVLVVRIGRRHGLTPFAAGVAGLLFAATPLAFTPLVWASGIQELLGCLLLLAAYDRWRGGSRAAVAAAAVCGVLALGAKEAGLGLPVLLVLVPELRPWRLEPRRWRLVALAVLALAAVGEAILVLRHFDTTAGAAYSVGGPRTLAANLGGFGWWLVTVGARFVGQMTWARAGAGLAVFILWASVGVVARRHGRDLPLTGLVAALLSLAPALPLLHQAKPYMALTAGAWLALSLATLLPRRRQPAPWLLLVAAVPLALGVRHATTVRLADVGGPDHPGDPVVQAMALSRSACATIRAAAAENDRTRSIVVFQQHLRPGPAPAAAVDTPLRAALGDGWGPALVAGTTVPARWVTDLRDLPPQAAVFCETGQGLEDWGSPWTARINAGLIDLVVGKPREAATNLNEALREDDDVGRYRYDQAMLKLPKSVLYPRMEELRKWMRASGPEAGLTSGDMQRIASAVPTLVAKVLAAGND